MVRFRLTPQNREFFELYARASANTVEIARLLVQLLDRFPNDGDALITQIKEREHQGDELERDTVAELFRSTDDAKVIIRWKDIHERLEEAVDALENAADVLEAIVVKNLATHFGYPLSTTHVISGAVMGAGATKRLSAVRWGVAGNIVFAWILTIPAAGLVVAALYWPVVGIF